MSAIRPREHAPTATQSDNERGRTSPARVRRRRGLTKAQRPATLDESEEPSDRYTVSTNSPRKSVAQTLQHTADNIATLSMLRLRSGSDLDSSHELENTPRVTLHGVRSTPPTTQSSISLLDVLSSLLPDELLLDATTTSPRQYEMAALAIDVSGFTTLCENYDKTGKGGPSKLTEVLNKYIGAIVEIILSYGGDIMKFAGDSIFCTWRVNETFTLSHCVHMAIDSAMLIKRTCREYRTEDGTLLHVKVSVAAGEALFAIIGTENQKNYVLVGRPVVDAKEAMFWCPPGEVLVSAQAWSRIGHSLSYRYVKMLTGQFIKVQDFGPMWVPVRNRKEVLGILSRPSGHAQIDELRPFVLLPIMRSFDLRERLEYLTEMRQVSIVFFNIVTLMSSNLRLVKYFDEIYQIICRVSSKLTGTVNKIFFFDKDLAVLLVFGLRGFQHDLVSQLALGAANECLVALKKLTFVASASAGVTTGMTYCGVIGHPARREYSVMGPTVNRAARLMCEYRNIVSCDRDTFLYSRLRPQQFELLDQRVLKGIQSGGVYYRYTGVVSKSKMDSESPFPILGREEEVNLFTKFFSEKPGPRLMLVHGGPGVGKSRLLQEFISIAEKQGGSLSRSGTVCQAVESQPTVTSQDISTSQRIEICAIPLNEDDYKAPYSIVRLIFQAVVGLTESAPVEEREAKMECLLRDKTKMLAVLNEIFNVHFDLLPKIASTIKDERTHMRDELEKELLTRCLKKDIKWLVLLDDAEFVDSKSWPLLPWLATQSNMRLVLAVGRKQKMSRAVEELSSVEKHHVPLLELQLDYRIPVACQMMNVRALPNQLAREIEGTRSSGNPRWLENYLLSILQSRLIQVTKATQQEIKYRQLIAPSPALVTPRNTVEKDQLPVCVLGPNFRCRESLEIEQSMNLIFVNVIDSLKPRQQLVLKIASALGDSFRTDVVKYILTQDCVVEESVFYRLIKRMFEMRIFECARGDFRSTSAMIAPQRRLSGYVVQDVRCDCVGLESLAELHSLPQYSFCGYLRFRSSSFRDTAYSLLLSQQIQQFHLGCIEFYKTHTYRCKSCGNTLFESILAKDDTKMPTQLICSLSPMHGVRSTKVMNSRRLSTGHPLALAARKTKTQPINHEQGDCQCPVILSAVYAVLLEQAKKLNRQDLILEIQLEDAAVCLTSCNFQNALINLKTALAMMEKASKTKTYSKQSSTLAYSKIYILMGAAKLGMGRPDSSLEFFKTALKYLGYSFPKKRFKVKWYLNHKILERKWIMGDFSENHIGSVKSEKAVVSDLMAECLSFICIVHLYADNWLHAKLAAVWSLNKALESNRNLFGLCLAYSNMVYMLYYEGDMSTCETIESYGLYMCQEFADSTREAFELEAIGRLYHAISQARQVRAEVEDAVLFAFKSLRIATGLRKDNLRLEIIPELACLLIHLNRISEAVVLLQELKFVAVQNSDVSGLAWYYTACLSLQLDTGYTVIPFEECQLFFQQHHQKLATARDPRAEEALRACVWLWQIRNEEWISAKALGTSSSSGSKQSYQYLFRGSQKRDLCVSEVAINLRNLEGTLLRFEKKVEANTNVSEFKSVLKKLIREIEKVTRVALYLRPRFLLLKSYYKMIRYPKSSFSKTLNNIINSANDRKDLNTAVWAAQLGEAWTKAEKGWKWKHQSTMELIDWHEAEPDPDCNLVTFALPLPK